MSRRKLVLAVCALALMAASAGVLVRLKSFQKLGGPGVNWQPAGEGLKGDIPLPEVVLNYVSTNLQPTDVEVRTLPKDTSFGRRVYQAPDGFQIMLGVVLMGTDRTSIHKPELCLTGQGWQIAERRTGRLELAKPEPHAIPVREFITGQIAPLPGGRNVRRSGVYVFWFVTDRHVTASHWARMGWITWDLLTEQVLPRWAYISAFAVCEPGRETQTLERVKRFLAAATPEFQRVNTGDPVRKLAFSPVDAY